MKPRLLTCLWFADASRHHIFDQGIEEGEQVSGRQQLYFIPSHRKAVYNDCLPKSDKPLVWSLKVLYGFSIAHYLKVDVESCRISSSDHHEALDLRICESRSH